MILQKINLSADPQLNKIQYQWAYDLVQQAIANTWFPHEVPLMEDLADWNKMTDEEKEAVTLFMSFFNPGEFRVNQSITLGMMPYTSAPEVLMYLTRQMWEEVNHSLTFEHVLQTFPIDREKAFGNHVELPSMQAKESFLMKHVEALSNGNIDIKSTKGIQTFVKNVVATNIITEGIWFYSGFMLILSFRQRNLLRNFSALIDWVLRDESLHLKFGIYLILTVLEEYPEVVTDEFAAEIREMILKAVELEEEYNKDLIPNGILGLNADYVNKYVKYITDRRLEELGLEPEFNVANPAKWMGTATDTLELVNFFETVNTNYEVNNG
ncbi:MAG: ribonucleotide-diphosphate reductase subunit beta [Candidatus Dojkabacteria bacterium]